MSVCILANLNTETAKIYIPTPEKIHEITEALFSGGNYRDIKEISVSSFFPVGGAELLISLF